MGKETGIKRAPATEADRRLADEFRANPVGQHSPDLQRLLNWFHAEEMDGKYCLICRKPHQEWVLARMHGRAQPIDVIEDSVFSSLADAEWAIFKLRWERHFGEALE